LNNSLNDNEVLIVQVFLLIVAKIKILVELDWMSQEAGGRHLD
jgi:hypothetical protein